MTKNWQRNSLPVLSHIFHLEVKFFYIASYMHNYVCHASDAQKAIAT